VTDYRVLFKTKAKRAEG